MTAELNLSTSRTEIPIKIDGETYTLKEADGQTARIYKNMLLQSAKTEKSGTRTFEGIADVEARLVSMCLFTETGSNVSESKVLSWPHRVIKPIYEKAKEISCLDETEEDEEETKN